MSVSFYNTNGTMVGLDFHEYLTGPFVAPPIPVPVPHFVMAGFDESCGDEATRLSHVTSDGKPMLQKEFKVTRVLPHAPLAAVPPHPLEALNLSLAILMSGSAAIMAVASVTGGGAPLATCLYSCIGSNLNCGDPVDMPSDMVINESSVLTRPTFDDYADAVVTWAVSAVISKLVGHLFDKLFGDTWTKFARSTLRKILVPLRKKAEEKAKDLLNDVVKELEDLVKRRHATQQVLSSLGVTHV